MERVLRPAGWIALVTFMAATGEAGLAGDAQIDVKYTSVPAKPLASDIKVISVRKPGYQGRANDDGIMRGRQERWYNLLMGQLKSRFRQTAPHVTVVNWEDRRVTYHQDLSLQLDGGDPEGPSVRRPKSSDAVIVARFVFSTPTSETLREKIPLHERAGKSFARRIVPWVGGAIDNPRYRNRYRVRVNVSCKIELIRSRTDETLASYARDIEASGTTDNGVFGLGIGGRQLFELDTVEAMLSKVIQEHVDNFLAEFLPVDRRLTKRLRHVKRRVARAVEKLNAGNIDGAIRDAFEAWGRDKKSHRACFVVGVGWELRAWQRQADWSEALAWYTRALEHKSDDRDYQDALGRVLAASGAQRLAGR